MLIMKSSSKKTFCCKFKKDIVRFAILIHKGCIGWKLIFNITESDIHSKILGLRLWFKAATLSFRIVLMCLVVIKKTLKVVGGKSRVYNKFVYLTNWIFDLINSLALLKLLLKKVSFYKKKHLFD